MHAKQERVVRLYYFMMFMVKPDTFLLVTFVVSCLDAKKYRRVSKLANKSFKLTSSRSDRLFDAIA